PKYPVGGDQPSVNTGGDTYPLDMSAALTADGRTLALAVVNGTEEPHSFALALEGFRPKASGRCWKFTGPGPDAKNPPGERETVGAKESTFDASAGSLTVAPVSVEIYQFERAGSRRAVPGCLPGRGRRLVSPVRWVRPPATRTGAPVPSSCGSAPPALRCASAIASVAFLRPRHQVPEAFEPLEAVGLGGESVHAGGGGADHFEPIGHCFDLAAQAVDDGPVAVGAGQRPGEFTVGMHVGKPACLVVCDRARKRGGGGRVVADDSQQAEVRLVWFGVDGFRPFGLQVLRVDRAAIRQRVAVVPGEGGQGDRQ